MDNYKSVDIDSSINITQYEKNMKNAISNLKIEHNKILSNNNTESTLVTYPFSSKKKHVQLETIIESDVLITPYNANNTIRTNTTNNNTNTNNWPSALIGVPHEKIVVLDNIESNGGLWRFLTSKSKSKDSSSNNNKNHLTVLIQFCVS